MQAVEPASRGRLRLDRQQLRQHRRAVGHVLAAREVHRAVPEPKGVPVLPGPGSDAVRSRPLADDERRLQALRHGAVPAGLPDRRPHPQRVRQRLHPARHLQRLRLLHRRLPLRRHHPQHASTATPTSARSATTGRRTAWCPPAPRPARPQSIQFGPIDELRERARKRVEDLHQRGVSGAYLYGDVPRPRLLRAEFVLPPGRSPRRVRSPRDARQPMARHEGELSPGGLWAGCCPWRSLLAVLFLMGR